MWYATADMKIVKKPILFTISIAVFAIIIAIWFVVTNLQVVSPLFLPSPKGVWEAFVSIMQDGYKSYSFWQHLGASLQRIAIAFGLAAAVGVPLGLASGYIPWIKAIFEPLVEVYRPLPPLAYYTVLIIWLGIDNESKIVLLFLACFAPIYVGCTAAVIRIAPNYLRNAEVLGASKGQIFFKVILPFSLPDVFSSMRIALGVGYTTLVASEMVAARSGIGWVVLDASNYLRSDIIFVGIIVMSITGILMDQGIRVLKTVSVPWEGKDI